MSNPHFNEFSLQYGISFYKWNLTFHSTIFLFFLILFFMLFGTCVFLLNTYQNNRDY